MGTGRVGSQVQDVTGTAGSNLVGEVAADSGGESIDHLVDGAALAGTQVPGTDTGVVGAEVVEGLEVAVGKVEDVDVVTDGGSVARLVVYCLLTIGSRCRDRNRQLTVTKNKQLLAFASSNLSQQRQQVVRNTLGVFTHDTTGVRASRVEVAQQSAVPLLSLSLVTSLEGVVALSVDQVGDGGLNGELGVSVGVGRAQRAILGDGDHVRETGSVTVDGGGAGEDDVGDIVADHGAQEAEGAEDVDMVVVQGLLARLADGLSQMLIYRTLYPCRNDPMSENNAP